MHTSSGRISASDKTTVCETLALMICSTHRAVDIFTALLILLLYPLLQEVDAQLEAEVLLLQVIQVL